MSDETDEPHNVAAQQNFMLGWIAVEKARKGDKSVIRARLLDGSVSLTMFEREHIAQRHFAPRKRPKQENSALLEAFTWLVTVENYSVENAHIHLFETSANRQYKSNQDDRAVAAIKKRVQRAGDHVPSDQYTYREQLYHSGIRGGVRPPYFWRPFDASAFAATIRNSGDQSGQK